MDEKDTEKEFKIGPYFPHQSGPFDSVKEWILFLY